METTIDRLRRLLVGALGQLPIELLQLRERLFGDMVRCQRGAEALQGSTDQCVLIEPGALGTDHHRRSVRLGDDVTLTLEAPKRLTNRCWAHSEELGYVTLAQVSARPELAGFDHPAQGVGNELGFALILDVGGRGSRDDANMIYQVLRPPAGTDMTVALSQPLPGVVQALLDRPESRNAIDLDMVRSLLDVVGDDQARVIVLGSTSETALSSGADLKLSDPDRAEVSRELYRLYELMRTTPAIIIVALSGHAVGGGAQLVVASDFTVAGPDATIRFRGPGHGIAVGAWALAELVGRGRAIDLALSMRPVSADEALEIGLIQRIDQDPLAYALSLAEEITSLWPSAVAAVKRIVGIPDPLQALAAERDHNESWDGAVPSNAENGPDLAG